mmetsp:Transcript_31732/g.50946  ORF Transcript_31732/g.50946 Transcript_31732/m.50946 type:complete len:265 (+) Transcript_31732:584-1378(+)
MIRIGTGRRATTNWQSAMGLKQHAIFQGAQVLVNLAAAEDGQLHEGTMNVHLEGTMGGHHREGMMDGRHREGTMDVHPREETTDDHPREGMKLLALVAERYLRLIIEGGRTTIVTRSSRHKSMTAGRQALPRSEKVLLTIIEKMIMIGENGTIIATIVQNVMTTEMTATIAQNVTTIAMVVVMIGDTPNLEGTQEKQIAGMTQGLVVEIRVQSMRRNEEDERGGQNPTPKNHEKMITTRTTEADETVSVIEEVATRSFLAGLAA